MFDFTKEKKKHHFVSDSLPDEAIEDSRSVMNHLNQLYQAIRQLSEVDRAVIMFYLEEKSYQEIAEIIGTNPNNWGIKRIKERLKNY
jgi:RNA polymerase sigma-70 factor (ECF subfamily)